MSNIIDYAGMYPPANLPLQEAFQNFLDYQSSPDVWMLSRFVIPARRLAELPKFEETLSFTVLGRGGTDVDDFLTNVNLDVSDLNRFRETRGAIAVVDMFETTLPASTLTDKFSANDIVAHAADILNKNGISIFFEAPFDTAQDKPFTTSWENRAENLLRALRKVKDKHVGFKLRTGGVTADAFPSVEQVAWAIIAAREAGVPFKYTAGLHHPLRHFNESVQTKMHGFLNVFGASLLALTNGLSIEQIMPILADEDPTSFTFDETGFAWKDLRVVNSELLNARLFITSFGSCSFDEPRDDLRALGLL